MDFLKHIYVFSLCIATVSGVLALKKKVLAKQLKIVILLVVYATIIEISVIYFKKYFSVRYGGVNNVLPQYNVFTMVEFIFYAHFFQRIIQSRRIRKAINIFLFLFPIFWYFCVFGLFTIMDWHSYVFLTGGTFTILGCLLYFHQLLNADTLMPLKQNSEFWIVAGLSVFYITIVPYMGMYHFLTKNIGWFAAGLKPLLQISNIIMYSLFAYAFLCQLKMTNTRKL